jgi:hypothetical protein
MRYGKSYLLPNAEGYCFLTAGDCRLATADCRLLLPFAVCRLPTADWRLSYRLLLFRVSITAL